VSQLALVATLLAAAIVMFAINKPRLDVVALIMLTALPFAGVLTTSPGGPDGNAQQIEQAFARLMPDPIRHPPETSTASTTADEGTVMGKTP